MNRIAIASSLGVVLLSLACGGSASDASPGAKAVEGGDLASKAKAGTPDQGASIEADAAASEKGSAAPGTKAETQDPDPPQPPPSPTGPLVDPSTVDALPPPPVPAAPPLAPAVADPSTTPEAAARQVLRWVRSHPPADGLPAPLLARSAAIAVVVREDACVRGDDDCTERIDKTPAELVAWLGEFDEMPGWDVADFGSCENECCTYGNLAAEADREGGSVPHELLEVRAVCLETDGADAGTIRRIKLIQY